MNDQTINNDIAPELRLANVYLKHNILVTVDDKRKVITFGKPNETRSAHITGSTVKVRRNVSNNTYVMIYMSSRGSFEPLTSRSAEYRIRTAYTLIENWEKVLMIVQNYI